ncbi:hypothetical protein A2291_01230 [candidate division WOR-1 bacterium RIFOXYB2_FULL_42_35]|nr:MAG: hypothetical protein A2247_04655 [candidate division WOR-1 bacterium RIFOXYA2_FULL_41_14]OGC22929.1 MAG: hypothetical protein A2291_01230 [candidate division WOR-1 bacterium RIFOXYB2_FULL_42_35]
MSLEKRIKQWMIDFYVSKDKRLAAELAYLYLCFSQSGIEEELAISACIEGFHWLKVAGHDVPLDLLDPKLKVLQNELTRWLKVLSKKPDCI